MEWFFSYETEGDCTYVASHGVDLNHLNAAERLFFFTPLVGFTLNIQQLLLMQYWSKDHNSPCWVCAWETFPPRIYGCELEGARLGRWPQSGWTPAKTKEPRFPIQEQACKKLTLNRCSHNSCFSYQHWSGFWYIIRQQGHFHWPWNWAEILNRKMSDEMSATHLSQNWSIRD